MEDEEWKSPGCEEPEPPTTFTSDMQKKLAPDNEEEDLIEEALKMKRLVLLFELQLMLAARTTPKMSRHYGVRISVIHGVIRRLVARNPTLLLEARKYTDPLEFIFCGPLEITSLDYMIQCIQCPPLSDVLGAIEDALLLNAQKSKKKIEVLGGTVYHRPVVGFGCWPFRAFNHLSAFR